MNEMHDGWLVFYGYISLIILIVGTLLGYGIISIVVWYIYSVIFLVFCFIKMNEDKMIKKFSPKEYNKMAGFPEKAPIGSIAFILSIKLSPERWKEFGGWLEWDTDDKKRELLFKCIMHSLKNRLECHGLLPSQYWGKIVPFEKL